jgi:uncharacterized membrane protein YeaQ/YmgE (transglycosylase-associated protein family)
MNLLISIAIGACLGLLRTSLAKVRSWRLAVLDATLGVIGSVPASWFLLPLSGNQNHQALHVPGLVGAVFGAIMCLAICEIVRP